jgi:translation initiation factor IF-2
MSHKHKQQSHHKHISKSREWLYHHQDASQQPSAAGAKPKLEFVLKCDSSGSVEAVNEAISKIKLPEVDISIIHSGVGAVNESDILMAASGSRLITGFQTDLLSGTDRALKEHGVEIRLYNVIYKLTADIKSIAESLVPAASEDEITGTARVIALFKSSRRGIIMGCEVLEGALTSGRHFRIISAMGPVYSGTIESMHIEKDTVQKATPGQQVGIKIKDFNKVKVRDIVEAFRPSSFKKPPAWQPKGGTIQKF